MRKYHPIEYSISYSVHFLVLLQRQELTSEETKLLRSRFRDQNVLHGASCTFKGILLHGHREWN